MIGFSQAKINLGLHVLSKRADGFHNIETIFYPIAWTDIVELLPCHGVQLQVSGIVPCKNMEDNVCVKAFRLLQAERKLKGAEIYLHKHVPFGAGLGGGSANAATMLKLINRLFLLKLNDKQLVYYASKLGSDCAFFIYDEPMLASGRGEILTPLNVSLPLRGYKLLIVKPNININTAQAYQNVVPCSTRPSLQTIIEQPIEAWQSLLSNDFEPSIFAQHPCLQDIKQSMYEHGAIYASMSGGGSAIFGIFMNMPTEDFSKVASNITSKISASYSPFTTFMQDL